jgi:hypothetical protein
LTDKNSDILLEIQVRRITKPPYTALSMKYHDKNFHNSGEVMIITSLVKAALENALSKHAEEFGFAGGFK